MSAIDLKTDLRQRCLELAVEHARINDPSKVLEYAKEFEAFLTGASAQAEPDPKPANFRQQMEKVSTGPLLSKPGKPHEITVVSRGGGSRDGTIEYVQDDPEQE